jgi:hypothetical protein
MDICFCSAQRRRRWGSRASFGGDEALADHRHLFLLRAAPTALGFARLIRRR